MAAPDLHDLAHSLSTPQTWLGAHRALAEQQALGTGKLAMSVSTAGIRQSRRT